MQPNSGITQAQKGVSSLFHFCLKSAECADVSRTRAGKFRGTVLREDSEQGTEPR